jgi:hypothetical protein
VSAVYVTHVELLRHIVGNFERGWKKKGRDTDILLTEGTIRRGLSSDWTRIRELLNANHANHYSVTFGIHASIIRNPLVNFIPFNRVCPVTLEREHRNYEVLMEIRSKRKHWQSIYVIIKQCFYLNILRYKIPVKTRKKCFLPFDMDTLV